MAKVTRHEAMVAIENKVLDCLIEAEETFPAYKGKMDVPPVQFKNMGNTNGRITYRSVSRKIERIVFNIEVAMRNLDQFISNTVPHEVAHMIDVIMRGRTDHGGRWQMICVALGGTGKRCTNYDRSEVPPCRGQQRRWGYTCDCSYNHQLSTTLHNRIQRGQQERICSLCRSTLTYGG